MTAGADPGPCVLLTGFEPFGGESERALDGGSIGSATAMRGCLIHIPWLPEQEAGHPGQPSMALD